MSQIRLALCFANRRGICFALAVFALSIACGGGAFQPVSAEVLAQGESSPAESSKDGPAVEAGRDAFQKGGYPWYDSDSDSLKRVPVSRPFQWPNWNLNWNFGTPGWLGWIPWLLILGILLAIAYVLFRVYRNRELGPAGDRSMVESPVEDDRARVEALPFEVRRRNVNLLEEAQRHYRQGDFSEAMIYLYSHLLVELDRHQLIRLTQGKTNRQYLREISVRPSLHALLQQAMVAFEDVFFGGQKLPRARFESCFSRLEDFQHQMLGTSA